MIFNNISTVNLGAAPITKIYIDGVVVYSASAALIYNMDAYLTGDNSLVGDEILAYDGTLSLFTSTVNATEVANGIRIDEIDGVDGSLQIGSVPVVIGKTYRLSFNFTETNDSGISAGVYGVDKDSWGNDLLNVSYGADDIGYIEHNIVAVTSIFNIVFGKGGGDNFYSVFDNFSLKEVINPIGTRFLENVGSDGATSNAPVHACQGMEFTGTQYIDVDLDYTLGDELGNFPNDMNDLNITQVINGTELDLTFETTGPSLYFSGQSCIANDMFELNVEYGGGTISTSFGARAWSSVDNELNNVYNNLGSINSTNKMIVHTPSTSSDFRVYPFINAESAVVDETVTVVSASLKQVIHTTQSLWIFDYSTNAWDIISDFDDIKYRIELKTIGHYFKLNQTHTQADIDLLNLNPELVVNLVLGDTATGLSFTSADVELYQPDKLSGAFVQCLSVSPVQFYSDPNLLNPDAWYDKNYLTFNNGKVTNDEGQITRLTYGTPYPNIYNPKYLVVTIDENTSDGYLQFSNNTSFYGEGMFNVGTYVIPIYYDTQTLRLNWREITTGHITISYNGLFEITNYNEAINFDPNQFLNASNLTTGTPLTMFKRDGTGRITAKADDNTLEFNGDGNYVDTGFIPDGSFTVSVVQYFILDGVGHVNGMYNLGIGEYYYNGRVSANFSGSSIIYNSLLGVGYRQLVLTFDDTSKVLTLFENSILVSTGNVDTITYPTASFKLGSVVYVDSTNIVSPIGKTIIHKSKACTQEEINAVYAEAKLLYPTLP